MGLFFNYSKPGPGVSKDEPKRKGIALYFQLFFRHIWDFVKENMLYVLVSIPMFLVYYTGFTLMDTLGLQKIAIENDMLLQYETIKIIVSVLAVILCGSGPASAGMAYMMRCVTREEHCFLWSDFWDKFKENFKHSIILSVIDVLVIAVIAPVAIKFYYMQYAQNANIMWFLIMMLVVVMLCLYIMMHIYFYQFIITFELGFFGALKNSLIMSIGFLPLNIIIIAIPVAIIYAISMYFTPIAVLLFTLIFLVAFLRYPLEFLSSRLILKKLIPTVKETDGQ